MLADAAIFERTHPALADYLRTIAALPHAEDDDQRHAEDAFEVRVLHFLTGASSDNPYWEIVAPAVSPSERHLREVNGGSPNPSSRLRYAQGLLQDTYAYAIPSPETVRWVADVAEGRPVVEIGAGRGYWANQLARRGLVISAYDTVPPSTRATNSWFPSATGDLELWHSVQGLRALARVDQTSRTHPVHHVLLLCWPPSWEHPMASRALTAYERRGGDRLIYIGETEGGRSGGTEFFRGLNERWRLIDQDPSHVVWQGLHDVAQCWQRASST